VSTGTGPGPRFEGEVETGLEVMEVVGALLARRNAGRDELEEGDSGRQLSEAIRLTGGGEAVSETIDEEGVAGREVGPTSSNCLIRFPHFLLNEAIGDSIL
jgi:hypothetical protein